MIKTAKYTTENKDRSHSEFAITVKYYKKSLGDIHQVFNLRPFQIPKPSILANKEETLNYFVYLREFTSSSFLVFDCYDRITKRYFLDNQQSHEIGNGLKDDVYFTSDRGTTIDLNIQVDPVINCEYNVETSLNIFAKFASVEPNLTIGDDIGMIYHKKGSIYEVANTIISDEYSDQGVSDCIYTIKNVWTVQIDDLTVNDKFESVSLTFKKVFGKRTTTLFSAEVKSDNLDSLKGPLFNFEIKRPDTLIKMSIMIKKAGVTKNIKENDILIDQNFFINKENIITITSKNKDQYVLKLKCSPFNYPIIFDIDQMHSDSSIVFAKAFKHPTPFKQKIDNNSPSSNRFECLLEDNEKYGIYKLEFEIDPNFLYNYKLYINALLIMQNLKPLCESNKIGEGSYIIKIPVELLKTYATQEGKTIAFYPIPFRKEIDPDEIEKISLSITLVDIYISPTENEEYCDLVQKFPTANQYIHSACILLINEENQNYNYVAKTSDEGVTIDQYHYPPNTNLDVEWKLFGIYVHYDKLELASVLLWQPEVDFPIDCEYDSILRDRTKYFPNEEEQYIFNCQRCKDIEYIVMKEPEETGSAVIEKNNKFSLKIQKGYNTFFILYAKMIIKKIVK